MRSAPSSSSVDEINQSVPKDIAMRVLTANMPTVRYDSSRKMRTWENISPGANH